MAKKTVNQQAAELSDQTKRKLSDLAVGGKSITCISDKYKLPYEVVRASLWQSGTLPWKGAKNIIARRFRKLSTAGKREERDKLVDDIREQVDYLYYAACQQRAQLDKVKIK